MIKNGFIAFATGSLLVLPVFFARAWLPGNDSDYHLAMALHPVELAAAREFPWLHWSYLRDAFVNHHIGFQFLASPLVNASVLVSGSPVAGAQAWLMICSGLTALCFYRILVLRSVPFALAWTALLGVMPWHFWMRIAHFRAPALALPMLLFAIELFLRRKYGALFLWALLFVLVYFGAVVFALVAAGLIVALWIEDRSGSSVWRSFAAVAGGLAAGFLLHPAFPECLYHLKVQLLSTGLSGAAEIGNEWRPPPAWDALVMWMPLLAIWWLALGARLRHAERVDGYTLGLLLVALAFIVLAIKARRFVEYAPVFVLISAADLARPALPSLAEFLLARRGVRYLCHVVLMAAVISGPVLARTGSKPGKATPAMIDAMEWLKTNSRAGALVMTDDWDLFPASFFLNRHNVYAVGLDPMFTIRAYPEIWSAYRELTRGRSWPLEDIREKIHADFVLVRNDHPRFYNRLKARPELFTPVFPADSGPVQPPVSIFRVQASPTFDGGVPFNYSPATKPE